VDSPGATVLPNGSLRLDFRGEASDANFPLLDLLSAGPIKWDLSVTISADRTTAEISGWHTCFPAHEVVVNGKVLWQYGPNSAYQPIPAPLSADDRDLGLLTRCLLPFGTGPHIQVSKTISLQ